MKTVIYHKSDFDGIFCREIARKHLTAPAQFIGWEYGDPINGVGQDDELYILDLSVPGLMEHPKLVWIDHHKTAIDKYPASIPGYRIDGVAACRLAWQWFIADNRLRAQSAFPEKHVEWMAKYPLPSKADFVDRRLIEPLAVRLAGEYDIWDKRDPDADLFQHGLRSRELTPDDWNFLLEPDRKLSIDEIERLMDAGHHRDLLRPDGTTANPIVLGLLEGGKVVAYFREHENESVIKAAGFDLQWEGLNFLACNAARYNSHLFTAGVKPEHDALLGFCWRGGKWTVSLYGAPHRPDVDLTPIATKHGGGGHKQACGFTVKTLPFTLSPTQDNSH